MTNHECGLHYRQDSRKDQTIWPYPDCPIKPSISGHPTSGMRLWTWRKLTLPSSLTTRITFQFVHCLSFLVSLSFGWAWLKIGFTNPTYLKENKILGIASASSLNGTDHPTFGVCLQRESYLWQRLEILCLHFMPIIRQCQKFRGFIFWLACFNLS